MVGSIWPFSARGLQTRNRLASHEEERDGVLISAAGREKKWETTIGIKRGCSLRVLAGEGYYLGVHQFLSCGRLLNIVSWSVVVNVRRELRWDTRVTGKDEFGDDRFVGREERDPGLHLDLRSIIVSPNFSSE